VFAVLPRPENGGDVGATRTLNGKTFEPLSSSFTVNVVGDRPAALPLHFYAEKPIDVVVSVDGGLPRRKAAGFARHVTAPRVVRVSGETRAVFVLGDDLAAGEHALSFTASEPWPAPVWVHAPWTPHPRPPRPARAPHWVEGELEE
jgi:hypothetical protein